MPSETHERLCRRLQDIDARVQDVLTQNDYDALLPLLVAHKQVMQALDAAGPCTHADTLALMTQTRDRLFETVSALESRREKLAGKLKTAQTKRKIGDAYGK